MKKLFPETIVLHSEKKWFYFLVELLLKIYKERELCPKKIETFREWIRIQKIMKIMWFENNILLNKNM